VVQEVAPRAPEALHRDVLGEKVLQSLAVMVQPQLEVTPNRSLRPRTLVLALEVVAVPDERLEFLSARLRRDGHGHRFATATLPVIGTDP
jgi:hypothetical protein